MLSFSKKEKTADSKGKKLENLKAEVEKLKADATKLRTKFGTGPGVARSAETDFKVNSKFVLIPDEAAYASAPSGRDHTTIRGMGVWGWLGLGGAFVGEWDVDGWL